MVKLNYSTSFDSRTGDIVFLTPCQWRGGVMVGDDSCRACRYFGAVTFTQQVECYSPYNLPSSENRPQL